MELQDKQLGYLSSVINILGSAVFVLWYRLFLNNALLVSCLTFSLILAIRNTM